MGVFHKKKKFSTLDSQKYLKHVCLKSDTVQQCMLQRTAIYIYTCVFIVLENKIITVYCLEKWQNHFSKDNVEF